MIKIDKNIAPPVSALYPNSSGHKSKYPFREMEIGDSFWVDNMADYDLKAKARRFSNTKAGAGMHFAVQPENGGARVWLVGIDND